MMKSTGFIRIFWGLIICVVWACNEYQPYDNQITDFSIRLNKVIKQKNLSYINADFSVIYNTKTHVNQLALSLSPIMSEVKHIKTFYGVQHIGYPHYEITVSDSTNSEECFAAVFAVVDDRDTIWSNVMRAEMSFIENGDSTLNGHKYVDLGLPSGTLWAECNIGAQTPREAGYFFAWGEIEPKESYTWETYKYCNGTKSSLTKYNTLTTYGENPDGLTVLEDSDDAAFVLWGNSWHIPSHVQYEELRYYCNILYEAQGKMEGFRVIGPNGKEIFLPGEGIISGWYWANILSSSTYITHPYEATGWSQSSVNQRLTKSQRYKKGMIRPVCKVKIQ